MNIKEVTDNHDCRGCGVCSVICSASAIELKLDDSGFYQAIVDGEKCIECGKCKNVCSVCNRDETNQIARGVYYAYDKDEKHRVYSSSGGIVGVLVRTALQSGYAVIGAAYDYEIDRVRHIRIDSVDDYYSKVSGSKYIPSYTVDGFALISELDKVMVIGTPCQIKALRSAYPDKELFCVDFKCYGVCSYNLWDKYLRSIRRKYKGRKIAHLHCHSKVCSWLKWGVELNFDDGTRYFKPKTKDDFGRIFSGMEYAGEHCLKCTLSGELSFADIRVEDGWQLSKWLKSEDYRKGASQVTVMSEKGEELWSKAAGSMCYEDVGLSHAVHGCHKHAPKPYLVELINDPAIEIEDVIRKYNKTIPLSKRVFDNLCNLLFDVPVVYFAVKRMYRKIKKIDQ